VRRALRLGSQTYRGVQDILVEQIVGSVARYHDFNRAFLPRREQVRERWRRVDRLTSRKQLSPIEVYKVDEVYFVLDGNHRVSVARQSGAKTIQAHVWEYETRVPVEANDDLNDILIRQEYLDFLQQTSLDVNRPEQRIVFTVPGVYRELGEEIAWHRHQLDQQHIYTVTFEEAAADWYDNAYQPMVAVVRRAGMLKRFPGRTEADLVAYILRYRDELQRRYGEEGSLPEEVAEEFVEQMRGDWRQRLLAWVKRKLLGWEILDRSE
jgi:hypothetical protein